MPIILVASGCYKQFKTGRGGRMGLLTVTPDAKMKQLKKAEDAKAKAVYEKEESPVYPKRGSEFDVACYRRYWGPSSEKKNTPGHFDHPELRPKETVAKDQHGTYVETSWKGNPRRFLLFGRPQIGKTGAFLHLIYLLWEKIEKPHLSPPDEIEVPVGIDDPDPDPVQDPAIATDPRMWLCFPDPEFIRDKLKFQDRMTLGNGKYGDPRCDELWKWYSEEIHQNYAPQNAEKMGRGSTSTGNRQHGDSSTKSASAPSSAGEGGGAAASNHTQGGKLETRASQFNSEEAKCTVEWKNPKERTGFVKAVWESSPEKDIPVFKEVNLEQHSGIGEECSLLSIPESQTKWWNLESEEVAVQERLWESYDTIKFPIFVPSSGRPDIALLDFSGTIPSNEYLQIVVVKKKEHIEYRQCWPHHTLLVLPESADDLGIGASRYWMQRFAEKMGMRSVFVLDDSIQCWHGKWRGHLAS
jgi:hypothetical protein